MTEISSYVFLVMRIYLYCDYVTLYRVYCMIRDNGCEYINIIYTVTTLHYIIHFQFNSKGIYHVYFQKVQHTITRQQFTHEKNTVDMEIFACLDFCKFVIFFLNFRICELSISMIVAL